MLDKLSTCLSHRWTLLLIVNKINKIITHGISSLRIPLIDIIKLIPKNMLIDLSIETSRCFALIDMNKHSGIAQLEQELCLVSDQLVGLNMWHIDINTNCISRVVNILPQMTCLKKLNISGNDITDVGLELLIEPLKYMTQLTSLELEATLITPIGLALLSNVFPLLINLTELNLAWLFLTDAVVLKYLLIKVPQLKSLNLSYNKLGNQGISVLASTFTSMIQLRTLKIDNNNIEDVSIMRDMIQKLTQLTSLNIGHRDFNNSTLLCDDIRRLTNLTVIDNCRITN
jgi:Ran GTPase-activating protein (RanGAP) involved in mRNA processing and transport